MVNLLPAVLVGGPPHAGKSVLLYQLRRALRERQVEHYLLRACPDGEGNWFHEGEPDMVGTIRVKLDGPWPSTFVERICQDLEHRCLPFLVDMGGNPQPSQECLLRFCTHSILLLREERADATNRWQHLVEENNLLPVARLSSQRVGDSIITARSPLLQGTLTGLERHALYANLGPVFEELVQRIADLFISYNLLDRKQTFLENAPTELVLDLDTELRAFTTTSRDWKPAMLPQLLERIPAHVPLAVYGVGPNWLYAALAAHTSQYPFYLFDPKLPFGWIQPAQVYLGTKAHPEVQIIPLSYPEMTVLKISFPNDHLGYFQLDPLALPNVSKEKGLLIDGRTPYWLLTALVRFYKAAGVPWIAPFYVPANAAIVAYTHGETYRPGDLVLKPPS